MSTETGVTNPYGWHLPATDEMVYEQSPYAAFAEPQQNIAERLFMLVHLCHDRNVWTTSPERRKRYWPAFAEHVYAATNTPTVSQWWAQVTAMLPCEPIRVTGILHEKNLLLRPSSLPVTPVADEDILTTIRNFHLELADRTRVWVATNRRLRSEAAALADDLDGDDDR